MKRYILTAALVLLTAWAANATGNETPAIEPDATYLYVRRDTCDLFLDVYNPAKGKETFPNGKEKPTVIFAFGGSFMTGSRDASHYKPWFRAMADNGYRIISIDYRLGMKGYDKIGIFQVNALDNAIHMAVEDMISATVFLIDNAESMGIDTSGIVISGSSAGAITALQTDYEACNGTHWSDPLPEGFRYAGVISFAGAILSRAGKLKYAQEPAPTLMFHGTKDSVVPYSQIKIFRLGMFGSSKIAERFKKFGYIYNIYREKDHDHEIAGAMYETLDEQFLFLEANVSEGSRSCIDATVEDPAIAFPEN